MKRICNWNCIENMNFHMQSSTVQLYLSSISKRTFCAKIEQSLGNSFQSNSKLHMVLFFLSSKLLLENKMVNTHENSSWQKKSWTNFEHVSLVLSNSLEIHQCYQLCPFHGSILETDILKFLRDSYFGAQ